MILLHVYHPVAAPGENLSEATSVNFCASPPVLNSVPS